MTEPIPSLCVGDLIRLTYAYTKILEKETRRALLEFAESCAADRLQLKESEHEWPPSPDDEAVDTLADK
ncbi:MAG: hypothetical protein HC850_10295 [Rhodomicrobium sp.]|nr:hypothetical protein [Rhodomicrobium sp.]